VEPGRARRRWSQNWGAAKQTIGSNRPKPGKPVY
jgi:hypothetical protein